ncbi:hypothetical protein K3495_g2061 [Podosphaera aphanis]|nr:hypothetical protein K3495_g2061 [Podosphaera aphanis]
MTADVNTTSSEPPVINADVDPSVSSDEFATCFYIGSHVSRRPFPVTDSALRLAQSIGYDLVTTPITTSHFHARILKLVSEYYTSLSYPESSQECFKNEPPAPVIPPLTPLDTSLGPGNSTSQLMAYTSPWIDLCSTDPLISNISRQVLNIEIAYASFCGINNVIIPGPKSFCNGSPSGDRLTQYARAIQETLLIGSFIQIAIQIPMYQYEKPQDTPGDLHQFARTKDSSGKAVVGNEVDLYETWDAWNLIRNVCKYNSRLSVALEIPPQLPSSSLQSRWFAEPLRLLSLTSSTFVKNSKDHPVLSKHHQALISRYMRLKQPPWLLLCDIESISYTKEVEPKPDEFPPLVTTRNKPSSKSPTKILASEISVETHRKESQKPNPASAHLSYLRYLQRNQPAWTTIEKFSSGYQDYLQVPLQPLTDNLESITYEVFEKDPVKYDLYEKAIALALSDWSKKGKPTSSPNGSVVIAVVGSGRGPLVTRALRASKATGVPVELWAIEKNPNAYVLLQRHNQDDWEGVVNVVKSDMRAWKGPAYNTAGIRDDVVTANSTQSASSYGKVDILVSELLGSFADNELSPECLDGVQHVLAPDHGISIPSSYTAHITPVLAPKLHANISYRIETDETAADTPYVVMLHAIDYLANSVPDYPQIQEVWEFSHPLPSSTLVASEARRAGGVSGGGGGSMSGGDGANDHNLRSTRCKFVCKDRGVVHGIAGYFEAVLYDGGEVGKIELSTRPDKIDAKSKDMISWFPIYFPLKNPLSFPDDSELEISMWRQTDDRKVWYEWLVEAFCMIGPDRRMRLGPSEMGSNRKTGCLM